MDIDRLPLDTQLESLEAAGDVGHARTTVSSEGVHAGSATVEGSCPEEGEEHSQDTHGSTEGQGTGQV